MAQSPPRVHGAHHPSEGYQRDDHCDAADPRRGERPGGSGIGEWDRRDGDPDGHRVGRRRRRHACRAVCSQWATSRRTKRCCGCILYLRDHQPASRHPPHLLDAEFRNQIDPRPGKHASPSAGASHTAGVRLARYWLESKWNCPPRASSEVLHCGMSPAEPGCWDGNPGARWTDGVLRFHLEVDR
jgi:hypothetical protein